MNQGLVFFATLVGLAGWGLFGAVGGVRAETGFLDRTVTIDGQEFGYEVYVPRAYDDTSAWPVILFLHGSGERGSDGLVQTQVGLGSAVRWNADRWPAIIVFPQAAEGSTWQGTSGDAALTALTATESEFRIDSARVYLTGMSLGGNGTWALAYRDPGRWAAIAPICGFVGAHRDYPSFLPDGVHDPFAEVARALVDVPVWIVHGALDDVVPPEHSRKMADALKAIGADVSYHELPDANHNAWDPGYGDPALAEWLLAQRR